MKKISKLLLAVIAMFGIASCNNDDVLTPDDTKGTTNARVTVSLATTNDLRAQPQSDEAGRTQEQTIATMHLIGLINKDWSESAVDGGGFWKAGEIYKTAPFETNPGTGMLAMALNKGSVTLPTTAQFASMTYGEKSSAIDNIAALSTDNAFLMTSKSAEKTIQPNIAEQDAKDGTDETKNVFKFDLERVVAQAFVSKKTGADGLKEGTTDEEGKINLNNITYSVMNGASMTYVLANHAGERKMTDEGIYTGFESAIHNKTVAEAQVVDPDFLIRIGNLTNGTTITTNEDLGGYKAIAVSDDAYQTGGSETKRGIYFLENSCAQDMTQGNNHEHGYQRLATVKVYATYTPNNVYGIKDGAKAQFVPATGSKIWYKKVETTVGEETTITYSDRTISDENPAKGTAEENSWVEGRVKYAPSDIVKVDDFTSGTTFYIGASDQVAYNSIEAALTNGNEKFYTYTDGRCGYYSLVNRTVESGVKFADARRNNIYALSIASFISRGFNWDPNDPNDPNLPKPDPKDPDENPDPDKHTDDIDPVKTYMRVEAEVLPWNLVNREINLGM